MGTETLLQSRAVALTPLPSTLRETLLLKFPSWRRTRAGGAAPSGRSSRTDWATCLNFKGSAQGPEQFQLLCIRTMRAGHWQRRSWETSPSSSSALRRDLELSMFGGSTTTAASPCLSLTSLQQGGSFLSASYEFSASPTGRTSWTGRPGTWQLCLPSSGLTSPLFLLFLM